LLGCQQKSFCFAEYVWPCCQDILTLVVLDGAGALLEIQYWVDFLEPWHAEDELVVRKYSDAEGLSGVVAV
jgi:hypothetical protein